MRMRDFIKENKKVIDRVILSNLPNIKITNEIREDWVRNNENLYKMAKVWKVPV
jgi:hypothetical protein